MTTTQTKHTPGPWISLPSQHGLAAWIKGTPDENGFAEICRFPDLFASDINKREANARLIAAAPELLSTLKFTLQWFKDNQLDETHYAICAELQDAIAKAEGES